MHSSKERTNEWMNENNLPQEGHLLSWSNGLFLCPKFMVPTSIYTSSKYQSTRSSLKDSFLYNPLPCVSVLIQQHDLAPTIRQLQPSPILQPPTKHFILPPLPKPFHPFCTQNQSLHLILSNIWRRLHVAMLANCPWTAWENASPDSAAEACTVPYTLLEEWADQDHLVPAGRTASSCASWQNSII